MIRIEIRRARLRRALTVAVGVLLPIGGTWRSVSADTAARALYESLGFTNREGKPDGPINYFYERDL